MRYAFLAVLVLALLSGCTTHRPVTAASPSAYTTALPRDPKVDYHDDTAVCHAFTRAIYTVNATRDTGPNDAYRRAASYVTAKIVASMDTGSRFGPDWQNLVDHHATTTVDLRPLIGDQAGHAPNAHAVSVLAIVKVTGRDGWQGPTTRHAVHCALAPSSTGELRVGDYQVEDLP